VSIPSDATNLDGGTLTLVVLGTAVYDTDGG
jgi:hypothetical protein